MCIDIVSNWREMNELINLSSLIIKVKPVMGTKRALEKEVNYTDLRQKQVCQ